MEVFTQQLINGITLGSIYGLIAIGYTMVFGIIGMVNFAHGDVFMVSSFIALITFLIVTAWLGISSVFVALLIVLIRQSIRTLHLDQNYEWIVIGIAIIIAVVLDQGSARVAARRLVAAPTGGAR